MLFRTYADACDKHRPFASWKERVILRVTLKDGRVFFRTYEFDSTRDKCKRCRKARPGMEGRSASTGHVCESCGNPYAGFVRQMRTTRLSGKWETVKGAWTSAGRLH